MVCIRKNDSGTAFRISITEAGAPVDVSAATIPTVLLRSPWGSYSSHTATINSGAIQYITTGSDFDCPGVWRIEAHFTLNGWTGSSSPVMVRVTEAYE